MLSDREEFLLICLYHAVLAVAFCWSPALLTLVIGSWVAQVYWAYREGLEPLEDWDPATEAAIDYQGLYASRGQSQQQTEAAVAGGHFAGHSSQDSDQETESSEGSSETVGSFTDAPDGSDKGDSSEETGDGTFGSASIGEHVIRDGVSAQASHRVDQEIAEVEPQTVGVEESDRSSGHLSQALRNNALYIALDATSSIPRVAEPRDGLQLCAELGWRQHADFVRATNRKSRILEFSMVDYSGPSTQLLGGAAQSEDGSSSERSKPYGSFVN